MNQSAHPPPDSEAMAIARNDARRAWTMIGRQMITMCHTSDMLVQDMQKAIAGLVAIASIDPNTIVRGLAIPHGAIRSPVFERVIEIEGNIQRLGELHAILTCTLEPYLERVDLGTLPASDPPTDR